VAVVGARRWDGDCGLSERPAVHATKEGDGPAMSAADDERLKCELLDRAVEIARRSLNAGPLGPRCSLPDGVSLRCAKADEAVWRERFNPGTPIEVDLHLEPGQTFFIVALPKIAEHISVPIGFEFRRG
jgi:hypothetical protein